MKTFRDLAGDVRFAWRMMHRQPVYAVASTLTLALGIGATTAVFAAVDATLLRPLAYTAPERLVGLNAMMPGPDGRPMAYSPSQIEHVRGDVMDAGLGVQQGPTLLYQTSYADPRVVAAAVMLLLSVSMAVVYRQAKRLANVSPVLALREDIPS